MCERAAPERGITWSSSSRARSGAAGCGSPTAIGSGGTVTNVGLDWTPYEPDAVGVVTVGATPTGTLIYRLCGGTATGDIATTYAAGTVLPGLGGTLTQTLSGYITTQFANIQLIATGGTVLASAELLGKKRFLTA